MSLYRVGEIWYIDLPTDKGRIRRSAGTSDKKEAQEYHDGLKEQLWREQRLGERFVTWGEAETKWLAIKERGMPDRYRLRSLAIPGETRMPLSATQTEELLASYSGATFNRTLALVIAVHGVVGVEPPKVLKRTSSPGRTRWLQMEEWKRLKKELEKQSPLLAQAAEFTLNTGLRENNVLNLEWSQVDLRRRVAWIHGDQTKAGQPIGVPLNDGAMAVLRARIGIDNALVFGNPDYRLYKASNRAWYTALRSAGLVGFRWHDLRHTWASWAVMNGVSLMELKELGGWKTLQMVARYAHLATEHLAGAAAKVKPVSLRYNAPRKGKGKT